MDGVLSAVVYEFKAEATPAPGFGVPIRFDKILEVRRSLPASELPHQSIRVFPPTNIKAHVHFPHVIYPIGSPNTLTLRIDGIAKVNAKVGTVEYWKLKKLTWRLEEFAKAVAPACERHTAKENGPQQGTTVKKSVHRTETRVIGEKSLFGGWKSNYAGPDDSTIEMELEYSLGRHFRYSCDNKTVDTTSGVGGSSSSSEVTHQLMVEMVVSQEWAPVGKPSQVTQTGIGRILRMHFATVLTERAGIGISWDNEAPPIYQDVPPSPPAYTEEIGDLMEHMEPCSLDG